MLSSKRSKVIAAGMAAIVIGGVLLGAMVFIGETDEVVSRTGGLAGMILFSFPLCLISWGAGR